MAAPILYYWGPCATCALVTSFADEHDNADFIPYLYDDEKLYNGVEEINAYLEEKYATA